MNVVAGERYRNVPDEVIRYVSGRFGKPTVAVDPDVLDKIQSSPPRAHSRRRAADAGPGRAAPPPPRWYR
jgi:pyruvate/oxaloacetate carboxyltransferase